MTADPLKIEGRMTRIAASNPPSSTAMSTERAAFRADVAEVERWWKVRPVSLLYSL
jgi:hypothetical protein